MKETIGVVLLVLLLIFLIGVGPLITLWSINALFGLGIAYNFWNWLAMAWIIAIFTYNVKKG